MRPDFDGVVAAWEADGKGGGKMINPLSPDDPAFWALGREQAAQVAKYAEEGARIIDFGCGIGRLTIPLVREGFDVFALDASPSMLEGLAERAAEAGVEVTSVLSDSSNIDNVLADVMGGQPADVIVARAVLIHHDYPGVERIVRNLVRALDRGGILIADWPAADPQDVRERIDWIDVTTWHPHHRLMTGQHLGLMLVEDGKPTVWCKR